MRAKDKIDQAFDRYLHKLDKAWNHNQTHIAVNAGLNACVLVGPVPLIFLPYNKMKLPLSLESGAIASEAYIATAGIMLYLMLATAQQIKKNREREDAVESVGQLAATFENENVEPLPISTASENPFYQQKEAKHISLKSRLADQFYKVVDNSPMFKESGSAELIAQAGVQSLLTVGAITAILGEMNMKGGLSALADFKQPDTFNLFRVTAASICGVRANYLLAQNASPYTFLKNPYLYVAGTFLAAGAVLPNDLHSLKSVADLSKLTAGDWVGLVASALSYAMYAIAVAYTWMASKTGSMKKAFQKLPPKLIGDHIPSLIFAAGCALALVPNILNGNNGKTVAMACEFAMCLSLYALKTKDGVWEFLDEKIVQRFKTAAGKTTTPQPGVPTALESIMGNRKVVRPNILPLAVNDPQPPIV
jgi:hypothetical protein